MFGLSVTGNTFLLWVCIGAVLAPTATFIEVEAPDWGMAAAALLMVFAVSGIGYQFVLMAADYQYLLSNVALQGQAQIDAAKMAVALNPYNDMYRAQVGMAYRQSLVDVANAALQAQQAGQSTQQYGPQIKQNLDASVAALEDTIKFVPDEYDNYVFITSVYNIGGSLLGPQYYDKAIEWAKKGMAVEPFGPAIRTEYARALLSQGKRDEGIKMLESGFAMDHAYVDGGELLADQYRAAGRTADAIDVLKKIIVANPTDTSAPQMLTQIEASATSAPATPTK